MPPKTIVNTEDILAAAISLVRTKGIESLNARSLAKVLGCSTKPLFRLYKNMDELKQKLFLHINQYCSEYLLEYFTLSNDHIGFALHYIDFAQKEPNLFKVLFMSNTITQSTIANMLIDEDIEQLLNEISKSAEIDIQEARKVYKKMWLLAHGIASIMVTNSNSFETEEVQLILSDAYRCFVLSSKDGVEL